VTDILKSFAIVSTGISGGLALWDGSTTNFKLTNAIAMGAGQFPAGNAWIRGASVTLMGGASGDWAIIGHSGANGDWVTSRAVTNGTVGQASNIFDDAAAYYFTNGEYFDVHMSGTTGYVIVKIDYVDD
jgi:hypothetical protein